MSFVEAKSHHPLLILLGLIAASLLGLLLVPAIAQDQAYHQLADQRNLLGIPNFWNVVSNIPFVVVGVVGLTQFRDNPATTILFLGFFLTGSAHPITTGIPMMARCSGTVCR